MERELKHSKRANHTLELLGERCEHTSLLQQFGGALLLDPQKSALVKVNMRGMTCPSIENPNMCYGV